MFQFETKKLNNFFQDKSDKKSFKNKQLQITLQL